MESWVYILVSLLACIFAGTILFNTITDKNNATKIAGALCASIVFVFIFANYKVVMLHALSIWDNQLSAVAALIAAFLHRSFIINDTVVPYGAAAMIIPYILLLFIMIKWSAKSGIPKTE